MMSKGFEVAHRCVDFIEAAGLEEEELNHCFTVLNQYYKVANEQNETIRSIKDGNVFLIGFGGGKL